mmetsp:Transcript_30742/g.35052  ORF Transcript_30742/g.35052 Transcript_30742/m.35052 type:complete len:457 (-) Transcript_30742:55-1425(-)
MEAVQSNKDFYVIVKTVYPTTYGCHRGRTWSDAEMIARSEVEVLDEKYPTFDEAVEEARILRDDNEEWFSGYEDELPENSDDLPPYDSADFENYDNDDEVLIRVVKESEIMKEMAEDEEFLQHAREKSHLESVQKSETVRLQLLDGGSRVFYSLRHKDFMIPAQFEFDESKEEDFTMPPNASNIPTLFYKVTDKRTGQIISCYEEKEYGSCNLLKLLTACTAVEELYLRSFGIQTILGVDFVEALAVKAPHLGQNLRILSLSGLMLEPSALALLGQSFPNLTRLDISGCFSTEYWEEPDFGEYYPLPYDIPLMDCLENLNHLKRLDLGNKDQEMRRYLYDYSLSGNIVESAKEWLSLREGRVTMDDDNMPEPFSDPSRKMAAEQQALLCVVENKKGKYSEATVKLAEEEMKTCPACGDDASHRCTGCKRQWYCNRNCQKKDYKKHKKQCSQKFQGS